MARFGWAYVNCTSEDGQAAGPTGSLQYLTGVNATSGSTKLLYHTAAYGPYGASTLVLTGTLVVTGTITASHFHIKDVTRVDATGSTYFGDTDDDVHVRTGSLRVGSLGQPVPTLQTNTSTQQTFVKGFGGNYRAVASTTHATSTRTYMLGVSCSQANGGGDTSVEVRLHSASEAGAGAMMVIKDEVVTRTTTHIIISASIPAGGFSIDGQPYFELTGTRPAISLYSNGTNWFVY